LTQRGTSQRFDAAVVVRTAANVSSVRVVIQLEHGATTIGSGRGSACRTTGGGLVCDATADANGITSVQVALRYPRQPRVAVAGTAQALVGSRIADAEHFETEQTAQLPGAR
jgi:hypothetical protein